MSDIPGSVSITGLLAPTSSADTYSVTDSIYGRDGLRNMSSTTEMYNISTDRRREGMIVGVYSGGTRAYFRLKERPWANNSTDWAYINFAGVTPTLENVLAEGNYAYTNDIFLSGRSVNYLSSSPVVNGSYYSVYADNSEGLSFSSSTFSGASHFKMFNHFFKNEFSFYSTENRMNSMFGIKHDYTTGQLTQIFSSATAQGIFHLTSGLTSNRSYALPDKSGTVALAEDLLVQNTIILDANDIESFSIGGIPYAIIPAPGANKLIDLISIVLSYTFSGDVFTGTGGDLRISGNLYSVDDAFFNVADNFQIKMPFYGNYIFSNIAENSPIYLTSTSASIQKNSTGTTGFIKIYTLYQIVDL